MPRDSTLQFAPHASARAALSLPQTVPTCRVAPPLAAPAACSLSRSPLRYYSSQRNVLVKTGTGLGGTFARRAKIEGSESLRAGREKTTLRRARLAIGKAGTRLHRLNRWKDRAAERTAAEAVAVYSTASGSGGSGDLEERTPTGTSASGERASGAKRAAVYIAHHRAAAGSDARFLHAQLERALGEPCFLGGRGDGAAYAQACDESLASARALVLVQTAEVLTVPRVLLDCYQAVRRAIPVVPVRIEGGDYDFDVARHFLEHLEEELPVRASAEALAELAEGAAALGVDVHAVQMALAASLPQLISCDFNSSGTDNQVNAALRDIADRLRRQLRRNKRYQGLGGPSPRSGLGSISRSSAASSASGSYSEASGSSSTGWSLYNRWTNRMSTARGRLAARNSRRPSGSSVAGSSVSGESFVPGGLARLGSGSDSTSRRPTLEASAELSSRIELTISDNPPPPGATPPRRHLDQAQLLVAHPAHDLGQPTAHGAAAAAQPRRPTLDQASSSSRVFISVPDTPPPPTAPPPQLLALQGMGPSTARKSTMPPPPPPPEVRVGASELRSGSGAENDSGLENDSGVRCRRRRRRRRRRRSCRWPPPSQYRQCRTSGDSAEARLRRGGFPPCRRGCRRAGRSGAASSRAPRTI